MNLQQLQINICGLIKSRTTTTDQSDAYINKISSSPNLLLIQKVALWWRRTHIEKYCLLTATLLKKRGAFKKLTANFFQDQNYSPFREEVAVQFLKYLLSVETDSLTRSVAGFEISLLKLKYGEAIEANIIWEYEPYEVIDGLLNNSLCIDKLKEERYVAEVSYLNKAELFTVKRLDERQVIADEMTEL